MQAANVNQRHQRITAAGQPDSAVPPAQAGSGEIVPLGQRKSPKRSFSSPIAEHSGSQRSQMVTLPGSDISKALLSGGQREATLIIHHRIDAPPVDDGYEWCKYGETNYYRCTLAPGCPARKKVERCEDDWTILTTSYGGTHSHPFSAAALAKASTTSGAAEMLLSGPSTSTDQVEGSQNDRNLAAMPHSTHDACLCTLSCYKSRLGPEHEPRDVDAAKSVYQMPISLATQSAGLQMHAGAMLGAMQHQHPRRGNFDPQIMADSETAATAALADALAVATGQL